MFKNTAFVKYLENFIWLGFFGILSLPLFIPSSFLFPFIFPRSIAFRITIELIFVAYLFLIYLEPTKYRYNFKKNSIIFLIIFAILIWEFVASIVGINWSRSFWGSYLRMDGLLYTIHLFLFLVVLLGIVRSFNQFHKLLWFSIAVSFLMSIIGFFQILGSDLFYNMSSGGRVTGTIGNSIFFASYILFHLFFIGYFILNIKNKYSKIGLSALLVFELFVLINTQSRGVLLGFLFSILLLQIFSLFSKLPKIYKIAIGITLLLTLISPLVLYSQRDSALVQNNKVLRRFSKTSLTDLTTQSRILAWQTSLNSWRSQTKSVIFGYGPENYYYAFDQGFPVEIYKDSGSSTWFDRAHNMMVETLVTTGVVGLLLNLILLLAVIYFLFIHYRKNKDFKTSWLLVALILAYFVQNLFSFDTINSDIPLYLTLAFIIFITNKDHQDETEYKTKSESRLKILLLILSLIILGLLIVNIKEIKANTDFVKVEKVNFRGTQNRLELYQQSLGNSIIGKTELSQNLASYTISLINSSNVLTRELNDLINFSIEQLESLVNNEPLNSRHRLDLALLYNSASLFDQKYASSAIKILKPAIEISPSRPSPYFTLGHSYALAGDIETGADYFKQGVALEPSSLDSHFNLLKFYIVTKNFSAAEEEYKVLRELQIERDSGWRAFGDQYAKIRDLYIQVGNLDKAIEFQEFDAKVNPSVDNYSILAQLYLQADMVEKSKNAFNEAIKLNPDLQGAVDAFWDSVGQK